jgi:hypothetical protein
MGASSNYTSRSGEGFSGNISVSKAKDLINFINGAGPLLK